MAKGGYNISVKVFVPCDTSKPAEAIKALQAIEEADTAAKAGDLSKLVVLLKADGVELDDFVMKPVSRRGTREG